MTDCLIIGHNDLDFKKIVKLLKAFGEDSGDYKNRRLSFIDYDNKAMRALDMINYFTYGSEYESVPHNYYNADFLQPAVAVLGSYLNRFGNLNIDYVNTFHREKVLLAQKLQNDNILAVAITTTFYVTAEPIIEIVKHIRKLNKQCAIILGGPYVASIANNDEATINEVFEYLGADYYIVSSEGEKSLLALIKALKELKDLSTVPNLYFRSGEFFRYSFKEPEKNELQENMVMWHLFKPYLNEFASIRTAKSCPFSCAFCGFPARLGKYVYYDIKFLEEELDKLKEMGVTTISYIDDTFNVPKARFKEILKMKIARKYNFRWNSFYRCDFGDEETVELMKESGCEGVFLGLESGSTTILENMNKALRPSHIRKMLPLLKQANILTYASLIVGFPGETKDTFQETMDLMTEVQPDFHRYQLWYCDKATPVWKDRDKYGIVGDAFNWSHKTMNVFQAAKLVEKGFLSQQNSRWLPEDSFEFWSVFYLNRKGFSIRQIKDFAEKFRVIIAKQKLLKNAFSESSIKSDIEDLRNIVLRYDQWSGERDPVNAIRELELRVSEKSM
jgi:radical SAM PhpK family P-methyltransferase